MSKDFNDYLNKNNLLDNIKIFSSVKHTELKNIYSSSDVMVLPSLFDGWVCCDRGFSMDVQS